MEYPRQWIVYIQNLEYLSDEWDRAYIAGECREQLNKLSDKRDALLLGLGLAVWHDLKAKQSEPENE